MVSMVLPFETWAFELDLTEKTEVFEEETTLSTEENEDDAQNAEFVETENFEQKTELLAAESGSCGASGSNVKWNLSDAGVLTISGNGRMADYGSASGSRAPWFSKTVNTLVIESGITYIGKYAFFNKSGIKGTLSIPKTVTEIGQGAFYSCSGFTGKLTIPEGVTEIKSSTFYKCSGFTSLSLPSTLQKIETQAFYYCEGLKGELKLPKNLISIGSSAFTNCKFSGNLVIPDSVTTVTGFRNCDGFNGTLTLGNQVKTIGSYAFSGCTGFIGTLIIPETVEVIETEAFADCSINEFYFKGKEPEADGATAGYPSFDKDSDTIYYPVNSMWTITNGQWNGYNAVAYDPKNLGAVAYGYCGGEGDGKNLTWRLDEDGVLTISGNGKMANYDYIGGPWKTYSNQLKTLVIEDGVTSIGKYAFYNCSKFTGNLVIPDSVTLIDEYAFDSCKGFSVLELGTGVKTINKSAFNCCDGFTGDLVIPDSVTTIGAWAFSECKGFNGKLILGNSITSIGQGAFQHCTNLTGILAIPESVTIIYNFAFNNCGINKYWFKGNTPNSITQVFDSSDDKLYYYPEKSSWSVENGKWNNFYVFPLSGYCGKESENNGRNLTWKFDFESGKLTISGTGAMEHYNTKYVSHSVGYITDAPWSAFMEDLRTLEIKEGITRIGYEAFNGCSAFEGELKLPASITEIYGGAFNNCSGFTGNLIIPKGVTWIGGDAFMNCSGFTGKLDMGNSLTSIGDQAFSGCSGLNGDLVIPESVETIGNRVFYNCAGLSGDTIISEKLLDLGDYAFAGCGVQNYYFKGNAPEPWNTKKCFDGSDTIYYPVADETWDIIDGKWIGYSAREWIITRGYCGADETVAGENLEWRIGYNGILKISGTGPMADYICAQVDGYSGWITGAPWGVYMDDFYKVVFEDGITHIGNMAFEFCNNITDEIVIPNTVKSIGKFAFDQCKNITGDLVIPGSVETIGESAFSYCGFDGNIIFSEGLNVIGTNAFYQCTNIKGGIDIPDSVTSIGEEAFYYFKGTGKLTLGKGVETIGDKAFSNALWLENTELRLPKSLKNIGENAFSSTKIESFCFEGDAPETVFDATSESRSFSKDVTVYFYPDKSGWELDKENKWKGYNVCTITAGDIDGDGEITVIDCSMVRRYTVKLIEFTELQKMAADVDRNEKINVRDANIIRRYVAELVESLPVEA